MDNRYVDDLCDRIDWALYTIEHASSNPDSVATALDRLAEVENRLEQRGDEMPFVALRDRLQLTETEQLIVMLLVALRLTPLSKDRVRRAVSVTDLTLDAIRSVVFGPRPSWRAIEELSCHGTLRRLGVIERDDDLGPLAHESKHTWAIAPRVLAFLHGIDALDASLATFCRESTAPALAMVEASADASRTAQNAMAGSVVIVAAGMEGLGRRTLLTAAARAHGRSVLEVDTRKLSQDDNELARQLRAVALECKLGRWAPLLSNVHDLGDPSRITRAGVELATLVEGPILATCGTQRPRIDWNRPIVVVQMAPPSSHQLERLWSTAIGGADASDARALATQYPLAPALVARAVDAAKARAGERPLQAEDVQIGIRAVLDERIGHYAKRVTITQTWADLVLARDHVDILVELMARIRERRRVYEDWGFAAKVGKGLGTAALFSGPPGTGKTMVAALLARDLGLELYQVDLGKVVSKYIGETEKNLASLFDAAEAGHAVILFDEADALFGRRTEVKSSNDRYANLETNYLLQRLETFTGICLLTSNHEANIDPAFLRRLSLHLRFELPEPDERARLWRSMLATGAPIAADVDIDSLARRFVMSGGYIRNAALRAAFYAADEESAISGAHLERAARLEYEGMGKLAVVEALG